MRANRLAQALVHLNADKTVAHPSGFFHGKMRKLADNGHFGR